MKGQPLMYGVEGPEGVSDYEGWGFTGKAADYIATASPATMLALLAEIEQLAFEPAKHSRRLIDQLKAENEDYKSGQERYEQIIEDLKAEIEALRKDAERYRWLRDKQTFIWLIQDWFPGEAMLTNVDADIDAAMAKEASHDR